MAARTPAAGGGCTSWLLGCVGVDNHTPSNNNTASSAARGGEAKAAKSHFPTLSGSSVSDEGSSWDGNLQTSDEELLEDLELVLEGRGLVSTIFLPPRTASDPQSVARTAFIRSKKHSC